MQLPDPRQLEFAVSAGPGLNHHLMTGGIAQSLGGVAPP